jgi:hypothetical protein
MRRPFRSYWIWVIYLVIGVIVAISENYWDFNFPWKALLSAILAVFLWPLLLVGIDLHIR